MTASDVETLTVDQVRDALRAFTKIDLIRLEKTARLFGLVAGMQPMDLVDLAIARTLEGKRKCPVNVPLAVNLRKTIQSLASNARRAERRRPVPESLSSSRDDGPVMLEPPEGILDQEAQIVAVEEVDGLLAELESLFEDDEDAWLVLTAQIEGLEASEIRGLKDWSLQDYATIRRRIRRTIAKRYPNGWRP